MHRCLLSLPHMSIKNEWCIEMKETFYVSWKPRNGTISKPEISKLFKSRGTRLNKILRVNLLSPFWTKSVCLKNKWRTLWLIPSKIPLLKELAGENSQCLNQPDPTYMDYFSLVLIEVIQGSSYSGKYQRAFQMPVSTASKSVTVLEHVIVK